MLRGTLVRPWIGAVVEDPAYQRPLEKSSADRGKVDRACVSFTDCGRVMRDIVLGMLCGATMGLFVAMVGDVF